MARRGARSRTLQLATAAALTLPLALAACGSSGNGGSSGSSGGKVTSLRVLDYYNNEPDKTVYTNVLNACGSANGVTIQREAVPGASLIPKVLQQSSSRTLPDVLMLDNPDLQQIAASGALTPLSDYGLSADGYIKGVVDASTYQGKLYGLQPITNSIALFYNKDILAKAGITPPKTWDELRADAKKLTAGKQYGIAFSAPANYEGTWQFLPFMWSNGGDEKNIATPQTADALQLWVDLVKDGSASKSVVNWTQADVNDQFKAGNAAMMINGPWQFPVLNAAKNLHYGVVPTPAPHAGATVVSPLGGETWTVPADRRQGARAGRREDRAVPEQRPEPDAARQGAADGAHQAVPPGAVRDPEPVDEGVQPGRRDGAGPHRRARRRLAEGRDEDLHRDPVGADRRRCADGSPAAGPEWLMDD